MAKDLEIKSNENMYRIESVTFNICVFSDLLANSSII